jgi:hypothetical protein
MESKVKFTSNMRITAVKRIVEKMNSGENPWFWNPTGIGILICGVVHVMRDLHRPNGFDAFPPQFDFPPQKWPLN